MVRWLLLSRIVRIIQGLRVRVADRDNARSTTTFRPALVTSLRRPCSHNEKLKYIHKP